MRKSRCYVIKHAGKLLMKFARKGLNFLGKNIAWSGILSSLVKPIFRFVQSISTVNPSKIYALFRFVWQKMYQYRVHIYSFRWGSWNEVCPSFCVGGPWKGCDWAGRFQQRSILVIADKRRRIQQITQCNYLSCPLFRAGNHPCKKKKKRD